MAKFKDTIDLYDDSGKLLKSGVPLDKISPLVNPATRKIIDLTKRTIAVNLGGIQDALKTGKVGKGHVLGREMDLDIVGNKDAVIGKIKEMVQVQEGDDTKIREFSGGGKIILVEAPAPSAGRVHIRRRDPSVQPQPPTQSSSSSISDRSTRRWSRRQSRTYPHTMDLGVLTSLRPVIPRTSEGLGYALRNIPVNHVVMMTNKNAMEGAALSSTFENAGMFEMGNAIGPFERAQLLAYAYQGLNANNLVYDLVKKNGSTGTIGTVVQSLVERAIEDKVITPGKKGGYFQFYDTKDPMLWNAYAAAGTMAATMVNCGAGRFAQAVSSTLLYFNDLLEHETGLPGCDYGRVMGTAVGFSFFSHSIYGGGGPGIFNGNHVVTRHAAGVAIPCVVAAAALDAGTQMFSPESTSKIYADTYGKVDVFNKPIQQIAQGV